MRSLPEVHDSEDAPANSNTRYTVRASEAEGPRVSRLIRNAHKLISAHEHELACALLTTDLELDPGPNPEPNRGLAQLECSLLLGHALLGSERVEEARILLLSLPFKPTLPRVSELQQDVSVLGIRGFESTYYEALLALAWWRTDGSSGSQMSALSAAENSFQHFEYYLRSWHLFSATHPSTPYNCAPATAVILGLYFSEKLAFWTKLAEWIERAKSLLRSEFPLAPLWSPFGDEPLLQVVDRAEKKLPVRARLPFELFDNALMPSAIHSLRTKVREEMDGPLVSIVIPSLSCPKELKITLDALIAHAGYSAIEILIGVSPTSTLEYAAASWGYQNLVQFVPLKGSTLALGTTYVAEVMHYANGELLCVLHAPLIPSIDFVRHAVKQMSKTGVQLITLSGVALQPDGTFGELVGATVPTEPTTVAASHMSPNLPLYQAAPDLHRGLQLSPFGYFFTRNLFLRFGDTFRLVSHEALGRRLFGIAAHLSGHPPFIDPRISCLYWPSLLERDKLSSSVAHEVLAVGYLLLSRRLFEQSTLPLAQSLAGSMFESAWNRFEDQFPELDRFKTSFWNKAVKTLRDYWREAHLESEFLLGRDPKFSFMTTSA